MFDYVKTIDTAEAKQIVAVLKMPTTHGSEDVACFDTEYALLIFNKTNIVTGYVNISLSCNKLISNPVISDREFYSKEGLRKVGFSPSDKSALLSLLEVK